MCSMGKMQKKCVCASSTILHIKHMPCSFFFCFESKIIEMFVTTQSTIPCTAMFDFDGINFVANGIQFATYDVIEVEKIKIDHKIRCVLEKAEGNWQKKDGGCWCDSLRKMEFNISKWDEASAEKRALATEAAVTLVKPIKFTWTLMKFHIYTQNTTISCLTMCISFICIASTASQWSFFRHPFHTHSPLLLLFRMTHSDALHPLSYSRSNNRRRHSNSSVCDVRTFYPLIKYSI